MPDNASFDLTRAFVIVTEALEKIANQAVCVNMDGDDGNERMLKDILQIADNALDKTKPGLSKLSDNKNITDNSNPASSHASENFLTRT